MADMKQLDFAYWYAINKQTIKRILTIILFVLNIVFWGIAITVFVRQFGIYAQENKDIEHMLVSDLVNYQMYQEMTTPASVQLSSKTVIRTRQNVYDLILRVKNPNEYWYASFDYVFAFPSGQTQTRSTFLLPGEERNLLALGVQSLQPIASFDMQLSNLSWRRIEDAQSHIEQRYDFSVLQDSIRFSQRGSSAQSQIPVTTLGFQIRNNSAFSYWQVRLHVAISVSNRIIAVNQITLDQFLAGETRYVEVNWFDELPILSSPQVTIEPVIDIFNQRSIIPPNGL